MPGVLVLSRVEEDQGFKVMLTYTISSRHPGRRRLLKKRETGLAKLALAIIPAI